MKAKKDRRNLGSSEQDALARHRKVQYEKALSRAGKALIAAEVALTTCKAFADELQTITLQNELQRVHIAEDVVRKMYGEARR